MSPVSDVAAHLATVRANIARAERQAGRPQSAVSLVAVSKTQPPEKIEAALTAGQRLFGENRVQEAQAHWEDLRRSGRYPDLRLHLIGPLQTNKVRTALTLFDVIETLDRPELAQALAAERTRTGTPVPPCFIQVNTGEEPQKHGILPAALGAFLALCRQDCGLEVRGLMCVPPVQEPAALHFAFLARLAQQHGLPDLSMGMSTDYEKAIPLGATFVRVGTAIFGERTPEEKAPG